MNRQRFSIMLMAVSILLIAAFQLFWLNNSYNEARRLFSIHANILFRETVIRLQASKLHLDTNFSIRQDHDPSEVIAITNVLQDELKDSLAGGKRTRSDFYMSVHSSNPDLSRDSAGEVFLRSTSDHVKMKYQNNDSAHPSPPKISINRVYDFLTGVDSLQDSISVAEVTDRYRHALSKEQINIPFEITMSANDSLRDRIPEDPSSNSVSVGFSHPVRFFLQLTGISWFTVKKVAPQLFFSLLLVSLTIFAFLVLYRNWQQQRNLTLIKNDFISNITHELKTPIATVSVAIEALKSFNALEDPAKTKEYLTISGNELQRLSLLVDKVLKLSMFEKEQVQLNRENFDLGALVDEVVSSMRLQLENYDAKLSVHKDGESFDVRADKLHITSVIYNLLDNALKYSKTNPAINIELKTEDDWQVFSVTDNGIGIPAMYQHKIFDKFFRIPSGDRHNVKGYGLGLSYVAYVLRQQGGSAAVESKEGIGSCFTIKIPRK